MGPAGSHVPLICIYDPSAVQWREDAGGVRAAIGREGGGLQPRAEALAWGWGGSRRSPRPQVGAGPGCAGRGAGDCAGSCPGQRALSPRAGDPGQGASACPLGKERPVHSGHHGTFHGTGGAAPVHPPVATLTPSGWHRISLSHPLIRTWSEQGAVPHHCRARTEGRVTTQPPLQAWSSSEARIGASRARPPGAARCFLSAQPQGLRQPALLGDGTDC